MADTQAKMVNCPSCGAKNPSAAKRCASCGTSMEALKPVRDEQRERERRYQQEGFSVMWAAIALGVQAVLTLAIIVALPQALGFLDFEGYYGMTLSIPVWFLGGVLVGLISPGKTFVEPVVAALIVAIPTVFFLYNGFFGVLGPGQTVRTMPIFMYIIMALIGVMFTLVGSYVGERIQMGPPPKAAT
jgi:ribosomal protein L40E